jgi:hypothetical protein
VAAAYSVVPVGFDETGTLTLASDRFHDNEARKALHAAIGEPVKLDLAVPSDVAYARHRLYDAAGGDRAAGVLAERLLARGFVDAEQLAAARAEQRRRYKPLGQVLVSQGLISRPDLEAALEELRSRPGMALGEHLVASGRLTRAGLESALAAQVAAVCSLGQVLLSHGAVTAAELESVLDGPSGQTRMGTPQCE